MEATASCGTIASPSFVASLGGTGKKGPRAVHSKEVGNSLLGFASSFCSWNARALFTSCFTPRAKAMKKMQLLKQLCTKYCIVMLQEVHGTRFDVETLNKEINSHMHFLSVIDGRNAGGILISISKKLMGKYNDIQAQELVPGLRL